MKVEDIKNVLIVGSGTMGQQIGFQCALYDCNVTLYDIKKEMLEKAMERINRIANRMIREGRITQEKAQEAISRIKTTDDMKQAAKDADIVSESVPEDPKLKGKVFGELNTLCPKHTIFTSNTSTLLPSMFAEATGRPENFWLTIPRYSHDKRGRCYASSRNFSGICATGKGVRRKNRSCSDRTSQRKYPVMYLIICSAGFSNPL